MFGYTKMYVYTSLTPRIKGGKLKLIATPNSPLQIWQPILAVKSMPATPT